jgi:phospholipase C
MVILMQGNRSFEHYFGSMQGVRGFGDRHAIVLPSGAPVWQQPSAAARLAGHVETGRDSMSGPALGPAFGA